jgi:zinc protease
LARSLSPYGKDDVRYVPTPEENLSRVEAVTLDQVKAVYETQLGGAAGELAVVATSTPRRRWRR